MAYVRANTAPIFGSRAQAVSPMSAGRLGVYLRASFPLPTTSLSRPIRLGDPGPFFEGPYATYGIPEWSRTRGAVLSGEWVPPATAPSVPPFTQGALTYRINPETGQYKFYATDITPRGPFAQNTFQHPPRPALSALGVVVSRPRRRGRLVATTPGGGYVVQASPVLRTAGGGVGPMVPLSPGVKLSGCGCGGGCSMGRMGWLGLGQDECSVDSDCGPGGVCGGGTCFTQGPTSSEPSVPIAGSQLVLYGTDSGGNNVYINPSTGDVYDNNGNLLTNLSTITPIGTASSTTPSTPVASTAPQCVYDSTGKLVPGSPTPCAPTGTPSSGAQQFSTALQNLFNSFTQPKTVTPTTQTAGNFLTGSTSVFGLSLPNPVLLGGVALIGVAIASGGRRR